jgi:hypothetical protein
MPLPTRLGLPLLALLALAPAGLAQTDEPGCGDDGSRPCEWVVAVDAEGIVEGGELNATAGEWLRLTVSNLDEQAHTVTVEGLGVRVDVPAIDARSATFQATREGDFVLLDQPSGTTGALHVLPASADVVSHDTSGAAGAGGTGRGTSEGRGTPGPGAAFAVAALAAAALASARRR